MNADTECNNDQQQEYGSSSELAALAQHIAVRLCLAGGSVNETGGYASESRRSLSLALI